MIYINCYWFAFKSSESSFLVIAINHNSLSRVYLADIVVLLQDKLNQEHELLTGFHFGWLVGWRFFDFVLIYNTIRKIRKGRINYYFRTMKHIEFLNYCAYIFCKSIAVPLS